MRAERVAPGSTVQRVLQHVDVRPTDGQLQAEPDDLGVLKEDIGAA